MWNPSPKEEKSNLTNSSLRNDEGDSLTFHNQENIISYKSLLGQSAS